MSDHHKALPLKSEEITLSAGHPWNKFASLGLILGAVGLGLGALFLTMFPTKRAIYFGSYLTSFLFFLSIALGAMFFVVVQHATQAGWSVAVRRLAEFVMGTFFLRIGGIAIPLFLLLFLPVLVGMHDLFEWTHLDVVKRDLLLSAKQPYLNTTFFLYRAAFYFIVWMAISWLFLSRSAEQDDTGDLGLSMKQRTLSPASIVLFALTTTFASFDWIMSLDPHWYSTIYGVYFFAGSQTSFFSLLALYGLSLRRTGVLKGIVSSEHYQDIGKLLFGFTVFWAYIGFSQFFLIWYGNIPEETMWYKYRFEGGWIFLSATLALGHFALPFFFLMSKHIKRRPLTLAIGAIWMLVMHAIDLYWLIMPTIYHHLHAKKVFFEVQDLFPLLCNFAGIGCLFLAAIVRWMQTHKLVPAKDPRLADSLSFENF